MNEWILSYHTMEELIKKDPRGMRLSISKISKRNQDIKIMAQGKKIPVDEVTPGEMDRFAGGREHRGIALSVPAQSGDTEVVLEDFLGELKKENALVVILDGVTDPQNFGALLRSCDKFETDLVVVPGRRSAGETSAASAASAGALAWVPRATVTNLSRALGQLKEQGFWIYGADMGGEPAFDMKFTGRVALILGSEGAGISRLVKDNCDFITSIPTGGHVDSLNVSVAAGILLYEIRRQQKFFK
ncbi:MAG: 23S rRNA (guanosine(2251)-2'-O)-methyltransferase RlmB [Spirochaetes bacterium GWB1_48_6]|nr:MAG: 23S rRNA (guanosine(2251)-2'-O)-methyltransferase RlmB [Spirochaetes bacterium GWB1_48_6]